MLMFSRISKVRIFGEAYRQAGRKGLGTPAYLLVLMARGQGNKKCSVSFGKEHLY